MFSLNMSQLLGGWFGHVSSTLSAGGLAQPIRLPAAPVKPISPPRASWYSPTPMSVHGPTFRGTMGRDVVATGAANDLLEGGMGDDALDAGGGDNIVHGGMGDDTLAAGDGANQLDGGMGNDAIRAGNGRNIIDGGMGDDRITAGHGGNRIEAGMGNDRVISGSGADSLAGGLGNDYLSAGAGDDTYGFGRAFGQDVIDNRDASTSTRDKVVFSPDSGIQARQMWFRRDGNDLVVDVVREVAGISGSLASDISGLDFGSGADVPGNVSLQGSGLGNPQREGQLTLRNWYTDPASQVDVFQDASGRTLHSGQVDSLVSAMAGFGAVPASMASLSDAQRQQLDLAVARNWAG